MSAMHSIPEIEADDFCRRFSMRASNLMWFLGAGASAAAGIPTAEDMVWEFKQQLFISQRHASFKAVSDLSSLAIRTQLQSHIDSAGTLPLQGAPEEYAALFEAVYPAESDRRAYLDAKVAGAKPSYGHLALATLMRARKTHLIWTTNFDPLIADGCAKVFETTGSLTTVALDSAEIARQSINEGRWPVEVKLHGDFRSRRLKNTSDELRQQDARLRQILVESCRRFGLIVVGCSGRDASIMDTLEEVLGDVAAFPAGLFWLHRRNDTLSSRTAQLISKAAKSNKEAALVNIESFDEALRDLIRILKGLDTQTLDAFASERRRWSAAAVPGGGRGWPVVRLNAIPILQMPSVCRRVVCQIGGFVEVRNAVQSACVDVIVTRTRAGILGFGSDQDMRKAFAVFGITDFDLHTIETRRLRYDSGERGMLREALTRSLVRHHGLQAIRRRSADLLAPQKPQEGLWEPLKSLVGDIYGVVSDHPELQWREGCAVRLDWADDQLWLLIEPRLVFEGLDDANRAVAADFARERTVKRYNRQLNDLIAFWANRLAGDDAHLVALGIGDGVDAAFHLSRTTGFSRRATP